MEAPAFYAVFDNLVLAEEDGRQDRHFGHFNVFDARRRLTLVLAVLVKVLVKILVKILSTVSVAILAASIAFAAARTWFSFGYHYYTAAAAGFQQL